MLLTTSSGTYVAHFTHIPYANVSKLAANPREGRRYYTDHARWSHMTICSIHHAPCASKTRPCGTKFLGQGAALCSVLDNFSKYKGRKVSFGRAIQLLPRPLRGELWLSFLTQNHSAAPKKCPTCGMDIRCVHGKLFTEKCEPCESDVSNETREGGGTVGPDSGVPTTTTGPTKPQEGRSHLPCS